MKTLLVSTRDEEDFENLSSLLKKLGYDTKVMSDNEKEVIGLLK